MVFGLSNDAEVGADILYECYFNYYQDGGDGQEYLWSWNKGS
jgi:hypothetical protein